jgi:phasin
MMNDATGTMHKGSKTTFELPKFNVPNYAVPEAYREIAEKGAAQSKEMFEKMRAGTEEATGLLENTFKVATTGATEFNRKIVENARANTNAFFDHAIALLGAKSPSEAMEVSTAHARKQFEAVAHQTKELTALAQKVTTETTEPVKASITKTFNKVA